MAKKVAQIRYYGTTVTKDENGKETSKANEKNFPSDTQDFLLGNALISGEAFAQYLPIYQLGIQGLPGTEFYLNGSFDSVIVGNTGVYELSVDNLVEILSLSFSKQTIDNIDKYNGTQYLIVDILYEDKEEG